MKICAYKYFPDKEKKNIEQEGKVLITSTEQINPCSLPSLNNLCMHVFLRISILLSLFFFFPTTLMSAVGSSLGCELKQRR